MQSYRTTRFIQISFVILIVVIIIVVIGYVGRLIFFPGTTTSIKPDASQTALVSTNADRAVRVNVRGPIVADEDFRSYSIRISPNERVLTLYTGYLEQPIDNTTLGNTIPAYEQFVFALNRAGMMTGSEFTGDRNDTRGVCATGRLYEFQILKADKPEKTLWAVSCSSIVGSFRGSVSTILQLFNNQIPGASTKIGRLW